MRTLRLWFLHSACAPLSGHTKPGLRDRYWAQFRNSRDDISNIGNLIRIPCSMAVSPNRSTMPVAITESNFGAGPADHRQAFSFFCS